MIRVVETDREFLALEAEWRRLESETRSSVFSGFDFIHASWTCLRQPKHRLLILVSETGGKIDTIAPLFVHGAGYRGLRYRQIGFIAEWEGDCPGILTTLPEEAAWRRILDFLEEEVEGWDAIHLVERPKMASGGDNWGITAHHSCHWEEAPDGVGYSVSLQDGWDSYLQGIGTKVKTNLRNKTRRLSGRPGGFTVECVTKPEEMGGALARFIAIEESGWKKEAGVGLAKDERHRAFYERLLVRLAEKGNAFVYVLSSGPAYLSAEICFRHEGRLYERHIAYSPAYSEYSPGIVLKAWVMESWFGGDCDELDMLVVNAQWPERGEAGKSGERVKVEWATDRRETVSLRGYRFRSRLLPWILGKKAKRMLTTAGDSST